MSIFFIRTLQLLMSISLLVLLHEFGHFIAAKIFKIRVEKFALFFDPGRALWSWKPKGSTTKYVLGWLPLGGYVKISGMVDESLDEGQMKRTAQKWEFRSKPAWQRLIVMLAGVTMNLIAAFFIYAMILFTWGENYVPIQNIRNGFEFNAKAQSYGFRNGDLPIEIDGEKVQRFDDLQSVTDVYRALSTAKQCVVLRKGERVSIPLPGDINMIDMLKEQPPFLMLYNPSVIEDVKDNSPASRAGIEKGDKIVAFNGREINTWPQFLDVMNRMDDVLALHDPIDSLRLRNINVIVKKRHGILDTLHMQLGSDFKLGVMWQHPFANCQMEHRGYSFLESFPAGVKFGCNVLKGYVTDLKYLFTAEGAKSIGSFGTIGALFPAQWDWYRFWNLTAFISLMLAFVNLLPIPALDGGHAFFLICEVVTGRKPSLNFMMRAQQLGMLLLLMLMIYAIFNDIMRFVF